MNNQLEKSNSSTRDLCRNTCIDLHETSLKRSKELDEEELICFKFTYEEDVNKVITQSYKKNV